MQFAGDIKNGMLKSGIDTARELAEACGVSYYIVLRLLKNDGSCRLNDLKKVLVFLDTETVIGGKQ